MKGILTLAFVLLGMGAFAQVGHKVNRMTLSGTVLLLEDTTASKVTFTKFQKGNLRIQSKDNKTLKFNDLGKEFIQAVTGVRVVGIATAASDSLKVLYVKNNF